MRMNKNSRMAAKLWNRELEIRRLISDAVAESRNRRHCHRNRADEDSHSPSVALEARVVPLDEHGLAGRPSQIELKNFDERGITFHHPQPLHDRRALIVLEGLNLGRIAAEVDLSWCRFSRGGQYTSGGRFVQLVSKTA